jgi:hypothetical protein
VSNEPPPPVDARGEDVERLVPLLVEEGCVVAVGAGCAGSGVGAGVGCDDSGWAVACRVTVAAGVTVAAALGAACMARGRAGAGLVCGRGLAKIATGTAPAAAEPPASSAGIRARAEETSNWGPTLALDRKAEVVERPSAKKLPNTTPSNSAPHSQRLVAAALGRPTAGGAKRIRSVASAWRILPGTSLGSLTGGGVRRYRAMPSAWRILPGTSLGSPTGGGVRRYRSTASARRILPGAPLGRPRGGGAKRYRSVASALRIMPGTEDTGMALSWS